MNIKHTRVEMKQRESWVSSKYAWQSEIIV